MIAASDIGAQGAARLTGGNLADLRASITASMATHQIRVITANAASADQAVTIDRAVEEALLVYFNKRADEHAEMIPLRRVPRRAVARARGR